MQTLMIVEEKLALANITHLGEVRENLRDFVSELVKQGFEITDKKSSLEMGVRIQRKLVLKTMCICFLRKDLTI